MVVNFAIQEDVTNKKDSPRIDWDNLSEFVRKTANDKNLSYRDIASRAGISHGVVGNIINKRNRRGVNADTLRAIAGGLDVDEDLLLDIAFGKKDPERDNEFKQSLIYKLYQQRKTASPEQRKLIDDVLGMLIEKIESSAG